MKEENISQDLDFNELKQLNAEILNMKILIN